MSRVLVLSPHPDDEAIGCGGAVCMHRAQGDAVRVVFLTSGERGGHGRAEDETLRLREAEAREAAAVLGYDEYEFWRLPDGALRAERAVVERLHRLVASWQPDYLYLPHGREMHPDHRATERLVRRALHGRDGRSKPVVVRSYEVWTPLQEMDAILDISPYVERKRAAIRAYRTQCDVLRFDDAALGLNRYRGEMHAWPGGDYAEVFLERHL